MMTSYRTASNHVPPGATHAYTGVDQRVPASGIFDAFRLKGELVGMLRTAKFQKTPLLNRHQKDGTVVWCRVRPFGLEFKLRTTFPSQETDELVEKIDSAFGIGGRRIVESRS